MKTRKNCMGTVSFEHQFSGMRKPQDFIVYPMHAGRDTSRAMVQSDTRIGYVDLTTGAVTMAGPRAGGAYAPLLPYAKPLEPLSGEDLLILKAAIFATASGRAGSHHVVTDNSAAIEVFGGAQ